MTGHDHSNVRRSAAEAIAAATEQWPSQIEPAVNLLKALYRDKAKVLAPEYDQYVSLHSQVLLGKLIVQQ